MSPAATFHAQLASIMEVLANTAVAEICELVDSGYSLLEMEISRSRKENELLRRKLRLMELRAARATALRAAATAPRAAAAAAGAAPLAASGRTSGGASGKARAQLIHHHPGNEPRRNRTAAGEVLLSGVAPPEPPPCLQPTPPSDPGQETKQAAAGEDHTLTATVIKVEEVDESWSRSEQDESLSHVADGPAAEVDAAPPLTKQETPENIVEVSSTSMSAQKPLNSSHGSDPSSYNCLMYEPPRQHTTQNPLSEAPGCSYVLSVAADSGGGGGFPFAIGVVSLSAAERQPPAPFSDGQQGTPPATGAPPTTGPHPPRGRRPPLSRLSTQRGKRWQEDPRRSSGGTVGDIRAELGREHGGGKSFVCEYCGKILACLKNLRTHMRVHTGEKPFVCVLCGKRFSDSSNLKRHQSVHTGEKRYGCVHCGKRFAQSGSLKVHMTVHTDYKQFRCSYCGKTFISSSHLRRHITFHAGEKQFSTTLQ